MCIEHFGAIQKRSNGSPPEFTEIKIKSGKIRSYVDKENKWWFCVNDLFTAFGNKNVKESKSRVRKENADTLANLTAKGGLPTPPYEVKMPRKDSIFVNEDEMWRLMRTGRTPICLELQEFLDKHVMPKVLREGSYIATLEDSGNSWGRYALATFHERAKENKKLKHKNNPLPHKPKE